MVLAVAALLLQFHTLPPPTQPIGVQSPVFTTVAATSFKETTPLNSNLSVEDDYITATTESSSSRLNLDEVHLVNSNGKGQFPGTVKTMSFETTADAQSFSSVRVPELSSKENSVKEAISLPSRRAWLALAIVEHGAAAFDAYSTRQAVSRGAVEDNPMLRPFASSPAIYVATQVAPVLFDLMARHMQRSEYPMVRRFWWVPQTASAGLSIFSGVHNLNLAGKM
jgi:hypothetical protein